MVVKSHRVWLVATFISLLTSLVSGQATPPKHNFGGTPWPDRRTIGLWRFASPEYHTAGWGNNPDDIKDVNPRGWHGDLTCYNADRVFDSTKEHLNGRDIIHPSLDMRKPGAVVEFRKRYQALVIRSREFYKQKVDAREWEPWQAVIVWDIEGQEFNHPTSYLGYPLPGYLSPELDHNMVRWTVETLAKYGLKAGFTIRYTAPKLTPYENEQGDRWSQEIEGDPAEVLVTKINRIRQLYGANACVFYFDSSVAGDAWASPQNHGKAMPVPVAVLDEVARRMPGNLIIPEFGALCKPQTSKDLSLRYSNPDYYLIPGVAPLRYQQNEVFTKTDALRRLDLSAAGRMALAKKIDDGRRAGGFDLVVVAPDQLADPAKRSLLVKDVQRGDTMLVPAPWLGSGNEEAKDGYYMTNWWWPANAVYREARGGSPTTLPTSRPSTQPAP